MAKVTGTYGTMYYVKNMKASTDWYRKHLQIEPCYESPEWTEFKVEGHSLCLHLLPEGQDTEGLGVLILQVEGLEEMVASLKKNSVRLKDDIHEVHPGAYSADFFDSEGNLVSLYENLGQKD